MSTKSGKINANDPLTFGGWFRAARRARKLKAIEISKRANLNPGYISDLERGRVQPKADTLDRIASALGLSALERAEMERRAFAQKPAKVAVPGLAIWKHLPTAIFQVKHELFELFQTDEILPDAVRFFSGLLGCVALHRDMLTPERRQGVLDLVDPRLQEIQRRANEPGSYPADFAWREVRRRVAIAWRQALFTDSAATDELVSLISEWTYQRSARSQPQFSVFFADKKLALLFDTDHGPLRRMMHVYDFFSSQWLLAETTIATWIAGMVPRGQLSRQIPDAAYVLRSLKRLSRIAAMTPDQMYEKASADSAWATRWFGTMGIFTRPYYLTLYRRLRFLYELPPAARAELPPRAAFDRWWKDTRSSFNQAVPRLQADDKAETERLARRRRLADELMDEGLPVPEIIERLDAAEEKRAGRRRRAKRAGAE